MEAARERDGSWLDSVELESRAPAPTVHECGLVASETFVFLARIESLGTQEVRITIKVTADLVLAQVEENPSNADMLVSA